MKPTRMIIGALLALVWCAGVEAAGVTGVERSLVVSGQGYFPVATRLKDGRIAVVMRGGAPHLGIGGRLDVVFSEDEGKTWSKPTTVVDSPVDDRNPAFGQAANGALVVAFWRTARYDDQGRYSPNLDRPIGTWVTRSEDGGKSWSEAVQIDVSDIRWGSPYGRMLTLADGSMLMNIYGGAADGKSDASYVYRSTDQGRTWKQHGRPGPRGFNETALLELPTGVILAAMRTAGAQEVCIAESGDGGKAWSEPRKVTPGQVHPADLTLLPDGRVLLVSGYRAGPSGVCGVIGDASGGFEWKNHFMLVDDAINGDCGYPSSVLLKDGRVLTVFYAVGCKSTASWGTHCGAVTYGAEESHSAAEKMRTGDEGMWTLNNLPLRDLKERYGFEPTAEWVQHVQKGAVRFNDGGSGAFVSRDGLVITNHHVALGQLQKMSTAERNYVREGFFAQRRPQEMRCPDLELNVLMSMEDVTQRVLGAVDGKATEEEQNRQRKAEIAKIEKDSTEQTKLRSDVVELYRGGEYWLYRYKKYTDVRLVMAPELQAAFFGGDWDNFTYPRYCLDFAFFRVYENDKPAQVEHYFKWSESGPRENELVFVAGHPGSTNRLRTVSQLQYERDYRLPTSLRSMKRRREVLVEYAKRGPEQARQVQDKIFGIENGIKANVGRYEGLKDKAIFGRLAAAEESLRKQVMDRPELASVAGKSWDRIAEAVQQASRRHKELAYRNVGGSRLVDIARNIVRYVAEVEKPNEKRYEEYRDSALESLELRLFSPAPIYPELEECLLTESLAEAREGLGAQDELIVAALGGREPGDVAREVIRGTRLTDPAYRKSLVKGGRQAVEQSNDPLIVWARKLDPIWRELRDWSENTIQSVEALEGAKIAKARFAVLGRDTYPDATFTLRLSYGRVAGYEKGTTRVPYKTTFYGLFGRAASFDEQPPFDLAKRLVERRKEIDLNTPLNFVSTNDIIGGNSGSPVLNRNGEYVGLIFDGNIESLVWAYVYDDKAGRAVSVHSGAIVEALREVYGMRALVRELGGR